MRASRPVRSLWEAMLDRLAERYAQRTSAASRGEVSMLAGVGVIVWALLTVTVLVSSPRALPLPGRTSLAVGVAGDLPSAAVPTPTPAPQGATETEALAPLAGPPPEATPSPSATPSPAPISTRPPVQNSLPVVVATNGPRGVPTPTPAPEPAAAPPSFAPPTPAVPTPGTPPARPQASASPAPTASAPAVQVLGANGAVLSGPRGGPLNTGGRDLYNCSDFTSLEQLIAVFLASGPADPNRLDPQRSGSPCPPDDEPQNEPVVAAGPEPPPAAPPPESPAPAEPPPAEPPPAEPPPAEPPPAEPPPAEPPPAP